MSFRAAFFLLTGASLLVACGARSTLDGLPSPAGAGGSASTSTTGTAGSGGVPGCVPSPEICDGLDNNCNGIVDETCPGCVPGGAVPCYPGVPDTIDVGVCKEGIQVCGADGVWGPCVGAVVPKQEACNGLDDDCNGTSDDGVIGAGEPCATGQPGECAAGITICKSPAIVCAPDILPSPEICDGKDNDCNGAVDEGCVTGCSDGTREGFVDAQKFPKIAGCSGGWSVPGLLSSLASTCGKVAGNSSPNPAGNGCSVADLCAPGFHVCTTPADVASRSPSGCDGAAPGPGLFFATRQSSDGCGVCAVGASVDPVVCTGCGCNAECAQTAKIANDLFGCGSLGSPPQANCGPLDRFSNDTCGDLGPPWACNGDGCSEANNVTKAGSAGGGVLCCAD
jgi:hypothetical protein